MRVLSLIGRPVAVAVAILGMALGPSAVAATKPATVAPVVIGLDAEFGHKTSTSAQAVRDGALLAMAEINAAGGVLGGRPLTLEQRDNRSNPARGIENIRDLAKIPDLIGVLNGKFSPVVLETVPLAQELGLILLNPWAAADSIVDNGLQPNWVFRLSLRDSWAIPVLLQAADARGLKRLALVVPNTSWGRSNIAAMTSTLGRYPHMSEVVEIIYNWGDTTMAEPLARINAAAADAVILVANETEGSLFVREMAALLPERRLPIFAHWGITGGEFVKMTAGALNVIDLSVVQTYTLTGDTRPRTRAVLAAAERQFGYEGPADIRSHVGFAHAYDLVHIVAQAINKAGTTDRAKVRDALERLGPYDGLIQRYEVPFTPERHEALDPKLLFVGRFHTDGTIIRR